MSATAAIDRVRSGEKTHQRPKIVSDRDGARTTEVLAARAVAISEATRWAVAPFVGVALSILAGGGALVVASDFDSLILGLCGLAAACVGGAFIATSRMGRPSNSGLSNLDKVPDDSVVMRLDPEKLGEVQMEETVTCDFILEALENSEEADETIRQSSDRTGPTQRVDLKERWDLIAAVRPKVEVAVATYDHSQEPPEALSRATEFARMLDDAQPQLEAWLDLQTAKKRSRLAMGLLVVAVLLLGAALTMFIITRDDDTFVPFAGQVQLTDGDVETLEGKFQDAAGIDDDDSGEEGSESGEGSREDVCDVPEAGEFTDVAAIEGPTDDPTVQIEVNGCPIVMFNPEQAVTPSTTTTTSTTIVSQPPVHVTAELSQMDTESLKRIWRDEGFNHARCRPRPYQALGAWLIAGTMFRPEQLSIDPRDAQGKLLCGRVMLRVEDAENTRITLTE